MNKCEECGEPCTDEENMGTNAHPICGICWERLHQPEPEDFSDADPGL